MVPEIFSTILRWAARESQSEIARVFLQRSSGTSTWVASRAKRQLVAQTQASWNHVKEWLQQMDLLRQTSRLDTFGLRDLVVYFCARANVAFTAPP